MRHYIALVLFTICVTVQLFSVIRRHDVPDEKYLELGKALPFVGLVASESGFSTGTLIAKNLVITSGHSVTPGKKCIFKIENPSTGEVIGVQGIPIHSEKFEDTIDENNFVLRSRADLALIFLDEPIEKVAPISISFVSDLQNCLYASAGHGQIGTGLETVPYSDKQKRGFSNQICWQGSQDTYGPCSASKFDSPESPCTQYEGCASFGDSGSPIIIHKDGEWLFVGISTHMLGDGKYNSWNCILSFADYRDWLEQYAAL